MTTAQDVFDIAMALMDESDSDAADLEEYKRRSLPILNILAKEMYQYSDTYRANRVGFRPVPYDILSWDTIIQLDDFICRSVLPYGLAAHLLLDENPTSADFFSQRYEDMQKQARDIPVESTDIYDIYGGMTEYGDFGRWG